jgi:hypothetical protein
MQLRAVRNCPVAFGDDHATVRRNIQITREPDTYFSIPARVKLGGKWFAGFIGMDSGADHAEGYVFHLLNESARRLGPVTLERLAKANPCRALPKLKRSPWTAYVVADYDGPYGPKGAIISRHKSIAAAECAARGNAWARIDLA